MSALAESHRHPVVVDDDGARDVQKVPEDLLNKTRLNKTRVISHYLILLQNPSPRGFHEAVE